MTTGYPDYQQNINITAQRASQLIQRPKYGAPQVLGFTGPLLPNGITTLGSISGRGIIYGGFIHIYGNSLDDDDTLYLTIDSVLVAITDWFTLRFGGSTKNHSLYLYLINNDESDWLYTVGYSNDITFESNIQIKFKEIYGIKFNCYMRLNYATI